MVLYFTGTGNSKYAASYIADALGDELVSLNDVIKNELPRKFESQTPFVIAAPIYAWRFPAVVEELIAGAEFSGSRRLYFVATMGSDAGCANRYCKRLANKKGLEYMGFCGVCMPDNYVIADVMPAAAEAINTIKLAEPRLAHIAEAVRIQAVLPETQTAGSQWVKSGLVNWLFNTFSRSCKGFSVSQKCVACGRCVRNCPVNNIEIKDKKPVFGGKCTACYSCIQRCPNQAIDIGSKTQEHGRYVCPEFQKIN